MFARTSVYEDTILNHILTHLEFLELKINAGQEILSS